MKEGIVLNIDNELDILIEKYSLAKKILEDELKTMMNNFVMEHNYNPIEHVKSRIKSKESIITKLNNKKLDITIENVTNKIKDIVGIRLVCSFLTDIYDIVSLISNIQDINIVEKKDYIINPKESGYTSYHIIVLVPIEYKGKKEFVNAEIQIRTVAQDFWASLNHKIQYKYEENIPKNIKEEMYEYSLIINQLDKKMVNLNKVVNGGK